MLHVPARKVEKMSNKGMVEVTGVWLRKLVSGRSEVLLEIGGSFRLVSVNGPAGGMSEIIEVPRSQAELQERWPLDDLEPKKPAEPCPRHGKNGCFCLPAQTSTVGDEKRF